MTYRARALRRTATAAERKLWRSLRNRQLGVKFRRQQVLGPIIVDFACLEAALIVEVDGPYHQRRAQRRRDRRREAFVQAAGWTVLRFSNDQVLYDLGSVLRHIRWALRQSDPVPFCPQPSAKRPSSPTAQIDRPSPWGEGRG